jgi:glycosyltransferase involved in cell wall biosynthesis
MNILVIYPWEVFWAMGENSGVASFFHAAHAYVDHGHTVDVVLPGRPEAAARESYHGMTLHRVPFSRDPLDLGRGGLLGYLPRMWRYVRFLRRMTAGARAVAAGRRPGVVVGLAPHAAPVARKVAGAIGVPNVTRLFGQALILYMDGAGRILNPLRFYASVPEVRAFRTPCAALIVHDDGSRGDVVARRLGVPAERLHFWRDGVDIPDGDFRGSRDAFRQRLGCAGDAVIMMSVGRLSPEKNLERVVSGFALAAERVPALELVFVGDGPSRRELEGQVARAGLTARTHFAEPVPRGDLAGVFAAADFVVSFSDRTNMTNSTIEAMAIGVPPVVLDAGTTSAVVQHERTGLLVGDPSPESIAAALCRVATNGELRARLGAAAREFVIDEFDRVEERLAREVELVVSIARNAEAVS